MSKLYFMIGLIIATVILIPLASIWSLNTLFPVLAIPYTFDTWCAAVVLGGVVGGSTGVSFKK